VILDYLGREIVPEAGPEPLGMGFIPTRPTHAARCGETLAQTCLVASHELTLADENE
jgi:hypothetical protein